MGAGRPLKALGHRTYLEVGTEAKAKRESSMSGVDG
jgi:hypothetical protein